MDLNNRTKQQCKSSCTIYRATRACLWQSWEFMETLAKCSVWLNASVGEMVAESAKTKSGAERCRNKLPSLHHAASAVCGVYRSVAKGEAENKPRSLRVGEAPDILQADWDKRRYLLAGHFLIIFFTLSGMGICNPLPMTISEKSPFMIF